MNRILTISGRKGVILATPLDNSGKTGPDLSFPGVQTFAANRTESTATLLSEGRDLGMVRQSLHRGYDGVVAGSICRY